MPSAFSDADEYLKLFCQSLILVSTHLFSPDLFNKVQVDILSPSPNGQIMSGYYCYDTDNKLVQIILHIS